MKERNIMTTKKKISVECKIQLPNGREMDMLLFNETPKMIRCNLIDPSGCDILYPLARAGVEVVFILGSRAEKMTVTNFVIHITPIDGEFVVTNCGIDLRIPIVVVPV